MRTILLFDDVDASIAQTSPVVTFNGKNPFEQRAEWNLMVTRTGLDGEPILIIEYSIYNDQSVWAQVQDPETCEEFFTLDDDISVIDDRLIAKWFRIRIEPNGNTTGTIKADLGYKTYP